VTEASMRLKPHWRIAPDASLATAAGIGTIGGIFGVLVRGV
jgi:hypothetical protein